MDIPELYVKGLHHSPNPKLAGSVRDHVRHAHVAADGGDGHDAAVVHLQHWRKKCSHHVQVTWGHEHVNLVIVVLRIGIILALKRKVYLYSSIKEAQSFRVMAKYRVECTYKTVLALEILIDIE